MCNGGGTRMDVFDKLQAADPLIVRDSGDIVRCFDDYCEGIQVRSGPA